MVTFLSKPAATPNGESNVSPRARTRNDGAGAVSRRTADATGTTPATRITAAPR